MVCKAYCNNILRKHGSMLRGLSLSDLNPYYEMPQSLRIDSRIWHFTEDSSETDVGITLMRPGSVAREMVRDGFSVICFLVKLHIWSQA